MYLLKYLSFPEGWLFNPLYMFWNMYIYYSTFWNVPLIIVNNSHLPVLWSVRFIPAVQPHHVLISFPLSTPFPASANHYSTLDFWEIKFLLLPVEGSICSIRVYVPLIVLNISLLKLIFLAVNVRTLPCNNWIVFSIHHRMIRCYPFICWWAPRLRP